MLLDVRAWGGCTLGPRGILSSARKGGGDMRIRIGFVLVAVMLFAAGVAHAAGTLQWVETDVVLHSDFKASVTYSVCWRSNGGLHGFYFQESDENTSFDFASAKAFYNDNRDSHPLTFSPSGNRKWHIVLAGGKAIDSGDVIYKFTYTTNLGASGYLGTTDAEAGKLVYLNWSPVQWDAPMNHYTVRVYYPIEMEPRDLSLPEMGAYTFKTEPFMNSEYLISYYCKPYQGKNLLTVRLHREDIPTRYHFRVQQYINARYFNDTPVQPTTPDQPSAPVQPTAPAQPSVPVNIGQPIDLFQNTHPNVPHRQVSFPTSSSSSQVVLLMSAALALLGFVFVVATAKHRSMLRAQDGLSQIQWGREDWTPPILEVSTFRKDGKIAELDIYEACIVCGVPFPKVLSAIVTRLETLGTIRVVTANPFQCEVLQATRLTNPYEEAVYTLLTGGGALSEKQIEEIFRALCENLQKKAWDSDMDATKAHYAEMVEQVIPKQAPKAAMPSMSEEAGGHRYFYNDYYWDRYPGYYAASFLMPHTNMNDPQFNAANAHINECFTHSACHDACHSACHDACHSACHSACHDACHSACHDACHSACVSGGSD